ncbi:MAG: peptidoglycan DD-metalloendopeptidase family protein [Paludibacter sp.]|nr:peptidoglycan DD-metalloendopeptidase family protein [Paludibacter sp.]
MIHQILKIKLKPVIMPNRLLIILISIFCIVLTLPAQNVKELERQRKQTLKTLETTSKMLNETKKSQRSSLNKLTIINKNITERKVLIKNISSEISQMDVKIDQLNQEKSKLENRLKSLKLDYANLIQEEHYNRSLYAKVMFVLSSKSFDQSLRRLRYLQEYSDYRKDQVHEIEDVKTQILRKNDSIQSHKTTKVKVVKQKETEAKTLSKDEQKEKGLLTDLQKKEKKLREAQKIQQKKADELNNKIEQIIAREIRKAEAKREAAEKKRIADENRSKSVTSTGSKTASKKNTPSTSASSVSVLTKEETLISGNFERNIGRLPWPTSNGFISGHYGIQQHPVLKHVTINNKGIYIQTPVGSTARAVFEGVVTQRFSIPGSNNGVIIQHGNYRTVYANLTQIYVKEGEHVSAKQAIGKIYTDDENDNKTELYFQIYNGRNVQNPESWIAR